MSLREWDELLPLARQSGLLGRLYPRLEECGLLERVPAPVLPHLRAAAILAGEHERRVRWEVNRIRRALADLTTPVILLKGGAYAMLDLPCARGRLVSDVDIMVPEASLAAVEEALHRHGWQADKLDDYDQDYYRRWMHELPPLRHRLRKTLVDVHHTILPQTSRLKPDAGKLLAASRPLGNSGWRVLAPVDMVLHSAAHAFHDGDLSNGLRDLVDLHDLLCHFGNSDFWSTLTQRAYELDLARPLYYTLRYCRRFLDTPLPPEAMAALHDAAPPWPAGRLMDGLMAVLITAQPLGRAGGLARWLLYIRSHWLRMPPRLLAGHLGRKAWRRLRNPPSEPKPMLKVHARMDKVRR